MDFTARERLCYVDWLRIGAFALLVLYHVGMVYVPWPFHVKHAPSYALLEPFMRLTNPWRMSLLFVISGLATGLMLGRAGLARERARRLLLPLAFGMAVVVPPQAWFQVREQFGYAGSYLDFLRLYFTGFGGFCHGRDCLVLPTWNHLWFLPYLWCYTALLLAALRWLPRPPLRALADALGRLAGAWLLLAPVLFLGAVRALLLPRFGETHALVDDPWAHATYAPLFLFGVLLARRAVLLERIEALRWPALGLAVAAWAGMTLWFFTLGARPDVPEAWRVPLRFVFAAEQWCGVVAAFGFARRHLNVDHRWRAPLTEAVFPLYIAHQTLIIGAFVALSPLALPAGIEALLLVAVAYAGSLAVWRIARRVDVLRPWMGMGMASRRAVRVPAQPAPSPLQARSPS